MATDWYESMTEEKKVQTLNEIIAEWRETDLIRVPPARVIPDTTNREYTGLSVNHVHFIAVAMQREGFQPRDNVTGRGHDLPLLVRDKTGTSGTAMGREGLSKWRKAQASNTGYPPEQPWVHNANEDFFCSLGNGHFFQALNLFGTNHLCRLPSGKSLSRYSMRDDPLLTDAVENGVLSVILRSDIPESKRKFVSLMLNSTFEFRWTVAPNGRVTVDDNSTIREYTAYDSLVKHADSFELDTLVELRHKQEKEDKLAALAEKRRRAGLAASVARSRL